MNDPASYVDPQLTTPDLLVLKSLLKDIEDSTETSTQALEPDDGASTCVSVGAGVCNHSTQKLTSSLEGKEDVVTTRKLQGLNDPESVSFEPTISLLWDWSTLQPWTKSVLQPYVRWAQGVVRNPSDVVMVTHLLLYLSTTIPSVIYLYRNFTYIHGIAHGLMQGYYIGTYTLMRHQHIHGNGILSRSFPYNIIDAVYPYILDPLMGHTWNSYYYHHVKHHHVEGNGPDDLSSTLRFQRDSGVDLLCYVGRFFFAIWLELPLYFIKKGQAGLGMRAAFWEVGCLSVIASLAACNFKPTFFALMLPLLCVRLLLMVGNWGQHAFVDEVEPDSDYRSSITLIDVASNRFCFNDGYHTSHHLNPRRHWREHPVAFLKQKERYASERALVFRNIDYIFITVRLVMQDYSHLAKCMVPIGDQVNLTMKEREELLRLKTRRFTEEDIQRLFASSNKAR